MPLSPGTRFGPYEITGSLGAGGMGEVYKARDTRLDRTVAIKVLPQLFATDPIFRARFDREARAISALNHPHICTLHDVGLEATTAYLVMECVDGEPLAGPLPFAQAIPLALQICDALEAAHRAGIVHRDLKPSNILVSKSGARTHVKLLDFGLATRVEAGQAASVERATVSALTGTHTILGTPQYMSPEQIEGREADARSDIFSLGCVLYELLTGRPAFDGKSPSSVMAAILATEPRSLRELVPITPPALDWIVGRCLAKDPNDRWQTVRDLRAALEHVLAEPAAAASVPPAASRATRTAWITAVAAGIVALAAGAYAAFLILNNPAVDRPVFISEFVPQTTPNVTPAFRLSLSPDGRHLVYAAPDEKGQGTLWVRSLDSLSAHPIPGTANGQAAFWSPDSRSIAFTADGKLKRVEVNGGPVIAICSVQNTPPGSWNRDDVILMTGADQAIARVPASGGTPEPVLKVNEKDGERIQIAPVFLPDGDHFIYASALAGARVRRILLASLTSKSSVPLVESATSNALYANGYILFLRDKTLMAQPFDATKSAVSGRPRPIAEDVVINPVTGTAAFTASQTGVIAYQTSFHGGSELTVFDRGGHTVGVLGGRAEYNDLRLSRDGKRAAFTQPGDGRVTDLWVYDFTRKLSSRLTFGPDPVAGPVWSPDGASIMYSIARGSGSAIVQKAASGAGTAEVVYEDTQKFIVPSSWSPGGRFLLYQISAGARTGTLAVLPLTGDRKPYRLLNSEFSEVPGEFSPDGRWIAYVSTQAGARKEVFVTNFPNPGGVWQISANGGDFPHWRRDGKEIFYLTGDRMMSAAVAITGDRVEVAERKLLFNVLWPPATRAAYDVTPDGQRFLVNVADTSLSARPITIVTNWTEKIKN